MTPINNMDWEKFYGKAQIAKWRLPAVSQENLDGGIFRDLFINWSKLPKKTSSGDDISTWFLCCDVLAVDKDIVIGPTVLVFARRIEITGEASLIFDRTEGNTQDIIIFAQEVVDKATGQSTALKVTTIGDDEVENTHSFQPDAGTKGASGFFWADQAENPETMMPDELESAYFYEGEPLRLALVTIFQVATLLSTENLELSMSQFRWVWSLTEGSIETRDLAAQANSMAMTMLSIKSAGKDALLVPQLELSIYSNKAQNFMDLLRDRQTQWENFQSRLIEGGHWGDAARDAIATQQEQHILADKLVIQAEKTHQQAINARVIAVGNIIAENELIEERKIDFDRGIKEWEKKQTITEVLNLVKGVVQIIAQIGAMAAGVPPMAIPSAGKTANGFRQSAANIVSSAMSFAEKTVEKEKQELRSDGTAIAPSDQNEQLNFEQTQKERKKGESGAKEGLKLAGKGAQLIYNAVTKISGIAQRAEQMEKQSTEILDSVNHTTSQAFSSYELQGLDVVTGGEQEWDLLLNAIEDTFESITELKDVEGGTAYRREIRRLVIYGKALSQTRLAVAKANAQLAEMKWRRIAAENSIKIAESRLNQLGDQIAHDQTFAQLVFGRILDAKRSVYLAMESYHRAFQYSAQVDEALAPPLPKITDSVDQFSLTVANISGRDLHLNALGQPPQTMERTIVCINSEELLNQLKSNKFVTWELSPDDMAFNGFRRVRFDRVRVFVEGLTSSSQIKVKILTSGVYTDKIPDNRTRRFVSAVTRRNFVYKGDDRTIVFDGDIARRYENDFFVPTPFTIWTLTIGRQDDQDIDLSLITGLKIEFHGEATSS